MVRIRGYVHVQNNPITFVHYLVPALPARVLLHGLLLRHTHRSVGSMTVTVPLAVAIAVVRWVELLGRFSKAFEH